MKLIIEYKTPKHEVLMRCWREVLSNRLIHSRSKSYDSRYFLITSVRSIDKTTPMHNIRFAYYSNDMKFPNRMMRIISKVKMNILHILWHLSLETHYTLHLTHRILKLIPMELFLFEKVKIFTLIKNLSTSNIIWNQFYWKEWLKKRTLCR